MITIRADWTLDVPEEERGIGWAGENEVERRVFVLPEGYGEDWVYRLDLRLADGSADIVLLEPEEGTLTWEITERHLAQNNANYGYVYAQIRADKGERVKKSSVAQFHVLRSIDAPSSVCMSPTEFEQAEERINELLLGAQEAEAGAESAQSAAAGSAAQAQAAQAAAESARGAAETARDEAEEAAGQTAADREAAGKDRAEVEKLAEQAAADAAQVAADRQAVAGDRLAADEAKTAAEAARDEAQRQAGLAAGSADGAAEAIAAFTDTTLPDAVEQVTEAGAAQAALAEAAADRAEAAAERAEGIDGWTKAEADDRFANALKGSASGELVRLEDVSPSGAFSRLAVLGETTETGEGEKSPDNPYTLSGAKPAALTVCGRNLLSVPLVTYNNRLQTSKLISLPLGTYYINCEGYTVSKPKWVIKGGNEWIDNPSPSEIWNYGTPISDTNNTFTVTGEYRYICFRMWAEMSEYGVDETARISISTVQDEPYEPYAGQSVSLPEGLELYGAGGGCDEYDAASGTLTRRWERLDLDGTESWNTYISDHVGADVMVYTLTGYDFALAYQSSVCSCFRNVNYAWQHNVPWEYSDHDAQAYKYFTVPKEQFPDVSAFKAWLAAQKEAGTPVALLYPLAHPAAEELGDPARIAPPAPVCQVYADAGTVEVAYNRDVNLAMAACEARLAALEEAAAALLGG